MRLNLAISREDGDAQQKPISEAVGAAHRYLNYYGDVPYRRFTGRKSKHRLFLMRIGSLAIQRGDRTYFVEAGNGLLLPAGEGDLTFFQCPKSRGLEAEIFEFDARTLAPRFRDSPTWEQLAYEYNGRPSGPLYLKGMADSVRKLDRYIAPGRRFHIVMGELFQQYRAGLESFLRHNFYLARWKLFVAHEKFVTQPEGLVKFAADYSGGKKRLRKDCMLYTGDTPEEIIAKRQCQVATVWLRCGHAIDEVSKALGFSSSSDFQSFYSGRMRRSCAATQQMPALTSLNPDELDEILRPYWWSREAPSRFYIPREEHFTITSVMEEDRFEREMTEEEMKRWAGGQKVEPPMYDFIAKDYRDIELPKPAEADTKPVVEMLPEPLVFIEDSRRVLKVPEDPIAREQRIRRQLAAMREAEATLLAKKRSKVAAEMREDAADFFAMKTTGAGIIVPIFGDTRIVEALAA